MTETYVAWAILSIAFSLGLAMAIKDPANARNEFVFWVVVVFRCTYIVSAFFVATAAIIWALSVVTA